MRQKNMVRQTDIVPEDGKYHTRSYRNTGMAFCVIGIAVCLSVMAVNGQSFHDAADNCSVCHVKTPKSVRTTDKKALKDAKKLVKDPNGLCEQCHENVHPGHHVNVPVKINKLNLPLDGKGRMTCAYTCHNVHADEKGPLRKALLRHDTDSLCLSCHEK